MQSRARVVVLLALALVALTACGCDFAGLMFGVTPSAWQPAARGNVVVRAHDGASWIAAPTTCVSGEPDGFHGVDLVSTDAPRAILRVVSDPMAGLRVRLTAPGVSPMELDRNWCRTLTGSVDRTNVAINRVPLLAGGLTMDCTAPDGTTIAGRLTFSGCHRSSEAIAAWRAAEAGTSTQEIARIRALPRIPESTAPVALRDDLRGVRVVVRSHLSGALVGGETMASAQTQCTAAARELMGVIGWVPVTSESEPHQLELDLACTGHVELHEVGEVAELVLPPIDGPFMQISAQGRVIESFAPVPRRLRCDALGTGNERMMRCAQQAKLAGNGRVVGLLNQSAALAEAVGRTR